MKNIILFLIVLFFVSIGRSSGQPGNAASKPDTAGYPYWIAMMQDPASNFFDVQRAFNLYLANRPVTKSCGWKPFKRWEYFWQSRVAPDGSFPAADRDWKELMKFRDTHAGTKTAYGNWTELGPRFLPVNGSGLGRVNAIAFNPDNADVIYAGAPSGGLWKTSDGGLNWTSNTDWYPTLGVSAIAVDYTNPQVIYVGTGDRDAGDAAGMGVMKTTDGGTTWAMSNTGMGNLTISRIIMHPSQHNTLLAATNSGIYKSTDSGTTWVLVSGTYNFKDIVYKPGNPQIVYASANGNFWRSSDGGDNWVHISNGLPSGSRGIVGVTPANPELVYFLIIGGNAFQGLYRSLDSGIEFELRSDNPNIMGWDCNGGSGGQAWYDLAFAVDPQNADILYAGGVNVFKSTDGGTSWVINAHWYGGCGVPAIHADQHVFAFSPVNGALYAGCDGGVFKTADGGGTWPMISQGLAIAQAYKIGQSNTVKDLVINGYQDNGTAILSDTTWHNVYGGDGMECAVDNANPLYRYCTLYYGSIFRIGNFNSQGQIAGNGSNGINEEGAWVTPFILHESDPNAMFVGYKNVWRSTNIKNLSTSTVTWTKISSFGSANCAVLEQSPANTDILYLAKENNTLYRSDNANATNPTWINLTSNLPVSGTATDLEAHPANPDIVYMTLENRVYRSLNKGLTWENISGMLPNVHISTIVYNKNVNEGLYIGTDVGVFYRDNSMLDWIPFSTGLPANGRVTELEIFYSPLNPADDRIRAATYGRGLWESGLYLTPPEANFEADHQLVPPQCPVNFNDLSLGNPFTWQWSFPGATPSSSSSKNPSGIVWSSPGSYDITLIVSNSLGSDTLTLPGYITVSGTALPAVAFSASDSLFCSGPAVVTFTDATTGCADSWEWAIDPATATFVNGTCPSSRNPQVEFTGLGKYTVSLTAGNQNGTSTLAKPGLIVVGGLTLPFGEDFESGNFSSKAWTIENPNNDKTWEITTVAGTTPGTQAAMVKIFGTNSLNHKDQLISPPFDFSGLAQVGLDFRHAYAQYQSGISDSLNVYISEDCGTTWTKIFAGGENGTGNFATHPPQNTSFVPLSSSDWCGAPGWSSCNTLDLTPWAGHTGVKIRFETVSALSNNLYIDNIVIAAPSGTHENAGTNGVSLFPNPATGQVSIRFNSPVHDASVMISDLQGRPVFRQEFPLMPAGMVKSIDCNKWNRGIYLVKILSAGGIFISKLILD